MTNELELLIIGAVVGFLSALLLEFARYFFDKSRKNREQKTDFAQSRERNLRGFLESNTRDNEIPLAWLKLVGSRTDLKRHLSVDQPTVKAGPADARNIDKSQTIRKFILGKTLVIGRQQDCEVRLYDLSVSRLHAMIRYEEGYYVIYDLGSTSGTYVNEKNIVNSGTRLFNGDTILIGESALVYGSARPDSDSDLSIVTDATSKTNTIRIKRCEIHGPYSISLESCPYCESSPAAKEQKN